MAPVAGAGQGHVIGTYLHGPLLARNADLADLLLGWATGAPLDPASSPTTDALRAQRIAEDRADPSGWGGRLYGRAKRRSRPDPAPRVLSRPLSPPATRRPRTRR